MNRRPKTAEGRLLRRLQWRMALAFALAFLLFDAMVVGLTYEVLEYHFYGEAKTAIQQAWQDPRRDGLQIDPDRENSAPRIVTWHFNRQGQAVATLSNLSGLPVGVNVILPNRPLLAQMPHTRTPLWTVVRYQSYRIMIGSRPIWVGGRYQGAWQSAYSMGRLSSVMRGLLTVDGELSLVLAMVVGALALWLSGRSLVPIREALNRQRSFVQDVSHELRTPLTIVKSSLELALMEPDRPQVDRAIRDVLSEVDYITRLTQDLSALARVGSGSAEIQPRTWDLFALAEDVATALGPLAAERDIHLEVTHAGPSGLIYADPTFVRQLLIILLDNALKYNRPGGHAKLDVRVENRIVHVVVEDTGAGIPQDELSHLFDRFYRSRTASRLAPGSGLGLAIARWIVQAHGGTIRAESELQKGTRVMAQWPQHVTER